MARRLFNDSSLKQLIGEMLKASGMERKYTELDIAEAYRQAVGAFISRKTREIKVREKTLVIYLDSGALKEELTHQKTILIKTINERIGKVVIEQIDIW
jgi:predicted nucleic acid-binding Zn ribbon protein